MGERAENISEFGEFGQDWLGGRESLPQLSETPMNTGLF